jgi:hypothetical protein
VRGHAFSPLAALLVAGCCAIASLSIAAVQQPDTGAVEYPCEVQPPAAHAATARQMIDQAYDLDRWRDPDPLSEVERGRLELHISCSDQPAELRHRLQRRKEKFFDWRDYRQIATEPGIHGEGVRWLEWLAIPAPVVRCETFGHSDWGRIRVRGGGDGLYQIQLPTWRRWGGTHFAPTANQATPYEQAVIAKRILQGQGTGAWSCW